MPDKPDTTQATEKQRQPSRGGLTMPADPARELQRLMMEEGRPSPPSTSPPAPEEGVAPEPATEKGSNVADYKDSEQHSNIATSHVSDKATLRASKKGSTLATERASNIANERVNNRASDIDSTLSWMRATSLSQLNIRIPDGMNDWLEEEAHRNRKRGVTKQSLVTDALEEFIRRRLEADETEGER